MVTPEARCQAVKDSVLDAGFESKVTVTCDATYAYVASDTESHVRRAPVHSPVLAR